MADRTFDLRAATLRLGSCRGFGRTWWLRGLMALVVPVVFDGSVHAAESKPPVPVPAPAGAARPETSPPQSDSEAQTPASVAHLSSKFSVDYRDPEKSVPTAKERDSNPLEFGYFLQDLLEEAELARKNNDLQAVIRFYRAVAKAVPDNAKGWSRLCEAYELVKDRERAIRACKYALARPAVELQDYVRYANLILAKDGALLPAEISDLNVALAHLEKQGSLNFLVSELRCQLGVKLKDAVVLEACTKAMARLAPNDPRTVVFEWSLAVQKGQRAEAQRLIERAVKAGVLLENIERMRQLTASLGGRGPLVLKVAVTLAALALVVAAALLAIRRRALHQSSLAR
jgi:tetratricopeptide (TPR) repeat protein